MRWGSQGCGQQDFLRQFPKLLDEVDFCLFRQEAKVHICRSGNGHSYLFCLPEYTADPGVGILYIEHWVLTALLRRGSCRSPGGFRRLRFRKKNLAASVPTSSTSSRMVMNSQLALTSSRAYRPGGGPHTAGSTLPMYPHHSLGLGRPPSSAQYNRGGQGRGYQ